MARKKTYTLEESLSGDLKLGENEQKVIARLQDFVKHTYEHSKDYGADKDLGAPPTGEALEAIARLYYLNELRHTTPKKNYDQFADYLLKDSREDFGLHEKYIGLDYQTKLEKTAAKFNQAWPALQSVAPVPAAPITTPWTPTVTSPAQAGAALETESTMDTQQDQKKPESLTVDLNNQAIAEMKVANFLGHHWDTDTMGQQPNANRMFALAQELMAQKRKQLEGNGEAQGVVELLAVDAQDHMTSDARFDVGLALEAVNKKMPLQAPKIEEPVAPDQAPKTADAAAILSAAAPVTPATSTTIPAGATMLQPETAANFTLNLSKGEADLEDDLKAELTRYWDHILPAPENDDQLTSIAKRLAADAKQTGNANVLEADAVAGGWNQDTLDRLYDASKAAMDAEDIPAMSPASTTASPAIRQPANAQTQASTQAAEEEPTNQASTPAPAHEPLTGSIFMPFTDEMKRAVREGETGDMVSFGTQKAPNLKAIATFVALNPGYLHEKAFVDAIMLEANQYGLTFEQYMALSAGGVHKLNLKKDGKDVLNAKGEAVTADVNASSIALKHFLDHSSIFDDLDGFMLTKKTMSGIFGFVQQFVTEPKLVVRSKNGNMHVDDGYNVRTLLAGPSTETINGKVVKKQRARYGARDAMDDIGFLLTRRLPKPRADGLPREMTINIKPRGMSFMPGRMETVRDLGILAALHHARKEDLALKLNVDKVGLIPGMHPVQADGTIKFDLLSRDAIAGMAAEQIGDVQELVEWWNKRQQGEHLEISGDAPLPKIDPTDTPTPTTPTPPTPTSTGPVTPIAPVGDVPTAPPVRMGSDVTPAFKNDRGVEPTHSDINVSERAPSGDEQLRAASDREGLNGDHANLRVQPVFDEAGNRLFGEERLKRVADLAEQADLATDEDIDPKTLAKTARRHVGPRPGSTAGL